MELPYQYGGGKTKILAFAPRPTEPKLLSAAFHN
jgi:hypothetical protein